MDELVKNWGVAGIIVAALAGYIIRIESRHYKERKEWRETQGKQFNRLNEINDETNKVLRENTNILQGLKTLLENRK